MKQQLIYRIDNNTHLKFTKTSNMPYDESVFSKFIRFCIAKGLIDEYDLMNIIPKKKLWDMLHYSDKKKK